MKMNEPFNSNDPEPKKIAVWAEGSHIEAKEFIMPRKSTASSDDIPTLPDLDDFPDILEKDLMSKPPVQERKDIETANTLADIGGMTASVEGIEGALKVLRSYIPNIEMDTADTVWTVDSLLTQLADEEQQGSWDSGKRDDE